MSTSCNIGNCPCKKKECPRHGKCCACINHHRNNGKLVACMRPLVDISCDK